MSKSATIANGICTNCERETDFESVVKEEPFIVKGEPYNVKVVYSKCKRCGDEVLDPNIGADPFNLAYREYRKAHDLLQPEEIRGWRRSLRLTQAEVSKLLGIGIATLNRYENGALQNDSHEKLLRLAMNPLNLLQLIEKSENIFTEAKKAKLIDLLRETEDVSCSIDNTIMINFGALEANEFNGYKKLDLAKVYNAILFLTKDGVLKSKLNKLLFYADFKYFKEYVLSITGLQYAHLPYGPVPDNYEMYYASLFSRQFIEFAEEPYPAGYVGEVVKAIKEPDLNIFSPSELRILAAVKEDFTDYNATQIMEFAHKELGYSETKDGQKISYKYANKLNY